MLEELVSTIEFQMSLLLFVALGGYLLATRIHQSAVIGEILVVASIIALVTQAAKLYPTLETPSNVIFQVAVDYLPLAFGALVMCACMAFIVTTANSFLLSVGVNMSWDVYARFVNPEAPTERKLFVSRASVLGLGILAYVVIQYYPELLILQQYTYTMYGAAITPALLGAVMFPEKITPLGPAFPGFITMNSC